jgi:hypothetical protein
LKTQTLLLYSGLSSLIVVGNSLEVEGAKHIGGALKDNTTLERLDISSNDVGIEGAQGLAAGLAHNMSVVWLRCCAIYFCSYRPRSLRSLGIANNALLGEGIQHIVEGITASKYVTFLLFSTDL